MDLRGAVLGLMALSIGMAISLPPILRARIRANEAAAVADTREVISAEQSYASANGGLFDELGRLCRTGPECLGIGIPDFPEDAPEFLRPELARQGPYLKDGYLRDWNANLRPTRVPEGSSPTSVLDYCYLSTPRRIGLTGARSFAGTGTGAVLPDPTGAPIPCPVPVTGCIFED